MYDVDYRDLTAEERAELNRRVLDESLPGAMAGAMAAVPVLVIAVAVGALVGHPWPFLAVGLVISVWVQREGRRFMSRGHRAAREGTLDWGRAATVTLGVSAAWSLVDKDGDEVGLVLEVGEGTGLILDMSALRVLGRDHAFPAREFRYTVATTNSIAAAGISRLLSYEALGEPLPAGRHLLSEQTQQDFCTLYTRRGWLVRGGLDAIEQVLRGGGGKHVVDHSIPLP